MDLAACSRGRNSATSRGFTSHLERVRVCCIIDGQARKAKHGAFAELGIPPSHSLDPGPGRIVKVKCSPDIRVEAVRLKNVEAAKLRVDFNRALTVKQFREFVRLLDDATLQRIDFTEDPCDILQSEWDDLQRDIPFDLAADRQPVRARVNVIKPACDNIRSWHSRVVFTSYMDHPIGQFFAAREAAAYYAANPLQREACGLCTHILFEPDEFIERVRMDDTDHLIPPDGTGLGFDDLLVKLPWKKLVAP
jgi:O-succinylbenzoate synthase